MATAHIVLAAASGRGVTGSTMPVVDGVPVGADTVTPGASSAVAGITVAEGALGLFWDVTALDAAIWVAFGVAPVAAAEGGFLIPAGGQRNFSAVGGQQCATKLA